MSNKLSFDYLPEDSRDNDGDTLELGKCSNALVVAFRARALELEQLLSKKKLAKEDRQSYQDELTMIENSLKRY